MGSANHVARVNSAVSFIEDKLRITMTDITIKDVKMCRNPGKQILWIESEERFVKRLFYKASILQDETIRIVQYTPHETFDRKVKIDEILKEMRAKEPNLKTQVRPGLDDWEIRMKKSSRFEYDHWDVLKPEDIDADNKIPKMNITHSKDDPKVQEFIQKKAKIVDEDGYEKVEGKRKASSPRSNDAKRTTKTPDSQISFHVRQVLIRNCNRPENDDNESSSSGNTTMEDNITEDDYNNESLEIDTGSIREAGRQNDDEMLPNTSILMK